jgi:hypothetical protein
MPQRYCLALYWIGSLPATRRKETETAMTTPSGYPGSSNDPYGSAGQYPSGSGSYEQPGQQPGQYPAPGNYPAPGQYQQYPSPNAGYPAAAAYGAVVARPGTVTAAAVLAFVVGGLLAILGLVALLAGSAVTSVSNGLGGLVIVLSILILAVGGVYIWSGVWALTGKNAKFLTIVAGVAAVLQLIGLISNFSVSSLVALAISIGIIALMIQPASRNWFRSKGVSTF